MTNTRSRVLAGVRTTTEILVGFAVCTMFIGGLSVVRNPSSGPPFLGWIFFLVSSAILAVTVGRWSRVLPGLLFYAVVVGAIKTITGDLPGSADDVLTRPAAIMLVIFFSLSGAIARALVRRKLTLVDRIALISFVFSLAWGMTDKVNSQVAVPFVGLAGLVLAWVYGRFVMPNGLSKSEAREDR